MSGTRSDALKREGVEYTHFQLITRTFLPPLLLLCWPFASCAPSTSLQRLGRKSRSPLSAQLSASPLSSFPLPRAASSSASCFARAAFSSSTRLAARAARFAAISSGDGRPGFEGGLLLLLLVLPWLASGLAVALVFPAAGAGAGALDASVDEDVILPRARCKVAGCRSRNLKLIWRGNRFETLGTRSSMRRAYRGEADDAMMVR